MTKNKNYTHIAVAGAGLIGKKHIETILQCKNTKLAAIIDPSPDAKIYSEQLNIPYYPNIEDMFNSQQVDGIVIATPNNCHLQNGLEVIKNKCPVLIEKPLATTSKEGQILFEEAKKNAVPILVGHHRRHNSLIKAAYDTIHQGDIGDIRGIHGQCWLYKPDEYFDNNPWRKDKGAGPVNVNLVHDIDLLRYLCGEIISIYAETSPAVRGYDNEDVASAILRFENNALCTISVSDTIVSPWSWELTAKENPVYSPTNESCYFIGGTKGSLSIPDLRLWHNISKRSWWEPITSSYLKHASCSPLHNQMKHFIEVIKKHEKPLVSAEDGIKNIQVIEAIVSSATHKKTIFL